MRKVAALILIAAVCVGAPVLNAAGPPDTRVQQERLEWVRKCMTDLESIKPGMTRAHLNKLLRMDGGLQDLVTVRYLHPQCPYFKINVTFTVMRNHADQGRVVPTQDDKVVSVSKPYLENPAFD